MKKKALLITLTCSAALLTLSSYKDGPAARGKGNLTGSHGSTCAQSGCHTGGTLPDSSTIYIRPKGTNGQPSKKYIPNMAYTVTLLGKSTASQGHYGFQIVALNSAKQPVGTIFNIPASTRISTGILEHSAPIAATAGGAYIVAFDWMAPPANSGPVTFHAIINVVNNDNTTGGDAVSYATAELLADGTGVEDVETRMTVNTYPNPTKNSFIVKINNAGTGSYFISAFDLAGRKMMERIVTNNSSQLLETINTEKWAAGLYHVQIIKDGQKYVTPVVKN